MPDLKIKENELKQLYGIVDEIPTKYGIQILGFFQGVTKLRAQETAQMEQAKKALDLAAVQQKLSQPIDGPDPRPYDSFEGDRLGKKGSDYPVGSKARAELLGKKKFEFTPEEKEALAKMKATLDGPTSEKTQRYLDHIGLGDPAKQGHGECFPCEEAKKESIVGAKGFPQKILSDLQTSALPK